MFAAQENVPANVPRGDLRPGAEIVGRVLAAERHGSQQAYVLDHVRWKSAGKILAWPGRVDLLCPQRMPLAPGDVLVLSGAKVRLAGFPGPRNPGQPDWQRLAQARGIGARIFAGRGAEVRILSRGQFTAWEKFLRALRDRWSRSLETPTDSGPSGPAQATLLLKGMVLGERSEIDPRIQQSFIRTNTFHILAISGQQMALIFVILFGILRAAGISQKTSALISIPAMVLYGSVVGWYASVARSVLMVILVLVGLAFDRKVRILRLLGIAALALLLAGPAQLFDVGFQLSFLAVAFLVLFAGPFLKWTRQRLPARWDEHPTWLSRLLSKALLPLFCTSLVAWLATAPLTAWRFNWFSPVTLLANLWIVGWVSLLTIPLGFVSVLLGSAWIGLAYPLNAANQILTNVLIATANALANIPYASFPVASPSEWSLIFYYLFFTVLAWKLEHPAVEASGRRRLRLSLVSLAALALLSQLFYARRLECVFFDVGQGDSIFVRFPNGKTMLVDAGPGGFGSRFENTVMSYMRSIGSTRINRVVMSHPHADHIGGLPKILEKVPVRELIGNGRAFASLLYRHLLRSAEMQKIPLEIARGPRSWIQEGGASVRILYPLESEMGAFGRNENEYSIVLALDYQGKRLLLSGDVEIKAEGVLARIPGDIRSDILKVPHHGGATSSTAGFLDLVKPRWAIISVGKGNKFGHPTEGALSRLRARRAKIFRTDQDGAVVVRSYGWWWTLWTVTSHRWAIMSA